MNFKKTAVIISILAFLIAVVVFSSYVNKKKLGNNSRASEEPTAIIPLIPSPTPLHGKILVGTCMMQRSSDMHGAVDLSLTQDYLDTLREENVPVQIIRGYTFPDDDMKYSYISIANDISRINANAVIHTDFMVDKATNIYFAVTNSGITDQYPSPTIIPTSPTTPSISPTPAEDVYISDPGELKKLESMRTVCEQISENFIQ